MIDISKEQYQMLKRINRTRSLPFDSMNEEGKEICIYLKNKGYLKGKNVGKAKQNSEITNIIIMPSNLSLTQSGKAQMYTFRSTFYNWWIPVIISIVSFIFSSIIGVGTILLPLLQH